MDFLCLFINYLSATRDENKNNPKMYIKNLLILFCAYKSLHVVKAQSIFMSLEQFLDADSFAFILFKILWEWLNFPWGSVHHNLNIMTRIIWGTKKSKAQLGTQVKIWLLYNCSILWLGICVDSSGAQLPF